MLNTKGLLFLTPVLIACSAAYVTYNYGAAFPQASLTLPLSSNQITQKAEQFLRTRGLHSTGFRNLTLFDPDELSRLYLERELGLEAANRLMQSEVPVWRWRARWFQPPQKEERIVWLSPAGRLLGFEHRVLETEAGARLDRPSARLLAEAFLQAQTNLPHKLVAEQSEARPNRDDHQFTWEQTGFTAKDATLRRTIVMHGNKVGEYREFLYVPEQWQRDFAKLRSANALYASIAQALYVLLGVGALVLLLNGLRQRSIPWRPLIHIGAVVAFFYFLNALNTIELTIDNLPTSSSFGEMLLMSLLDALGSAMGTFGYVLAPAAAAAVLYSRTYPGQMPLSRAFTRRGIGTRSFLNSTLAGFSMAAAHMMFLTAFYLYGSKFGIWSPQEVEYSDVLATPMPWVYPIAIALMAGFAEEFWFRLLAIPLLKRVLRVELLAIVIPAFVWGFLHANYPQQPGYVRGVEVGIIGLAAGWMMLRFGIVATLVWHYTIDAFLIGLFLFRAENWTYRLHGAVVALAILAPLIASVVLYRRNRGFLPEVESQPVPEPEAVTAAEPAEPPLTPPWPAKYLYAVAAVLVLAVVFLRPVTYGDFVRVNLPRDKAETLAKDELRKRNRNPDEWMMVSDFTANIRATDAEYLRQQFGPVRANEIIRDRLPHSIWRVRFFQPLNPEEWAFFVDRSGKVYRSDHTLDEKAPGAQLSSEEARRIAEDYLTRVQQLPLDRFQLVDSQQDKRDRRTDHSFVWEEPELHIRHSLQIVGDEPSEFRTYLKLPEEWLRDYNKPRITAFLQPALLGSLGVPLAIFFLRRLGAPGQQFHWRIYALAAGALAMMAVLSSFNESPLWLRGYDTATPLKNYYGQLLTFEMSSALLLAVGAFVATLAVDVYLQALAPNRTLPRPSFPRIIAVAAAFAGMTVLSQWINQHAPGPHFNTPTFSLTADTLLPSFSAFYDAVKAALLLASLGIVFVIGALRLLNSRRLIRVLILILVVFAASHVTAPLQIPFALATSVLTFGLIVLVALTCATDVLSIGFGILLAALAPQAIHAIRQPVPFLQWNGWIALVMGLALACIVSGIGQQVPRSNRAIAPTD